MRIKKGDTVKILSGKDRGKTGKVLRVNPKNGRILVEGANIKKRHVKSKRQDKKGEVILIPTPFPAAKAMPVCSNCKKPTRIGYLLVENGKTRTCKKCGQAM